jgi:hypothetical protein
LGLGTAGSLPILQANGLAQGHQHGRSRSESLQSRRLRRPSSSPRQQLSLIATISELIIPTDDHSPGAIAAEVPAFTDLMVSESPAEVKKLWTDGLTAMDSVASYPAQRRVQREQSGAAGRDPD